jgi:hypothetical protein
MVLETAPATPPAINAATTGSARELVNEENPAVLVRVRRNLAEPVVAAFMAGGVAGAAATTGSARFLLTRTSTAGFSSLTSSCFNQTVSLHHSVTTRTIENSSSSTKRRSNRIQIVDLESLGEDATTGSARFLLTRTSTAGFSSLTSSCFTQTVSLLDLWLVEWLVQFPGP